MQAVTLIAERTVVREREPAALGERQTLYADNRAAYLLACGADELNDTDRDALLAVVFDGPTSPADTTARLAALCRCVALDDEHLARLAEHPAIDMSGLSALVVHPNAGRNAALAAAHRMAEKSHVSARMLARLVEGELAETLERAAVLDECCGPLTCSELDELESRFAEWGTGGMALLETLARSWSGNGAGLAACALSILTGKDAVACRAGG